MEVREYLVTNFWAPFVFFIVWGVLVVRVSYLIAIKRVTEPFRRFQDHMAHISVKVQKTPYIHREYDDHMKDISYSFNDMIDSLFQEIEKRDQIISELQEKKEK